MVKKEFIGTTVWCKTLQRNITINEGPTEEWFKLIGLSHILEKKEEPKIEKSFDSNTKRSGK